MTKIAIMWLVFLGASIGCSVWCTPGPEPPRAASSSLPFDLIEQICDFKEKYPGGMVLLGAVDRYKHQCDIFGRDYYHGKLTLKSSRVLWVGPEYGSPKAAQDIFSRAIALATAMPSPHYQPPVPGGAFVVSVTSSPVSLVQELSANSKVLLGVARAGKYPVALFLWGQDRLMVDFPKSWDKNGGRPGSVSPKKGVRSKDPKAEVGRTSSLGDMVRRQRTRSAVL